MSSPDTGRYRLAAADVVSAIPHPTPRRIVEQIRSRGYVGQEQAVHTAALAAYRHVSRLRWLHCEGNDPETVPPKTNLLFAGPTGCGKTYLVEILFREILSLPTVIVDMTTYSETGYVGQDVSTVLTRLLYAADMNPVAAAVGIVCLDEFDKLATGQNNAVFAGAGTTKDVSGLGVQRELLKMLESAEVAVSVELSHSDYAPKSVMPTRDIPFIACGAFSGLKGMIDRTGEHIGFGRTGSSQSEHEIAFRLTQDEVEATRNFIDYGFLPELIARFKRVVPFAPLEHDDLVAILRSSLLPRYRQEFASERRELLVDDRVLDTIVGQSIRKETGARGLESALMRAIEEAAFEAYSQPDCRTVSIVMNDGRITHRLD